MWKQGDVPEVENLENHLAAIDRAKDELGKINSDIKVALEQKALLLSDNDALSKEKRTAFEKREEELKTAQLNINERQTKNSDTLAVLEDQYKKFAEQQEQFSINKIAYLNIVQNKEKELDARETEARNVSADLDAKQKELNEKAKENDEILNRILDEKKRAEETLAEALGDKKFAQEQMDVINEKIKDCRQLKSEAEALRQEAQDKFETAQLLAEESRKNKADSQQQLADVLREKESLNDLIIDSKRIKFEANKSVETAQRIIVESNIKIAELKDLKAAMAQQEK